MLVRFSSTKTESITMFGDVAVQLIRMLGASGAIPGAISASDIPSAVRHLRQQLKAQATPEPQPSDLETDDIALSTRAVPLLDLLERAGAANVPVMWEAA